MKFGIVGWAVVAAGTAFADIPLPEHPRPDFERAEWINLNGEWDFHFDGLKDRPERIVVPFGWGTRLSGVKDPSLDGRHPRGIGDTGNYSRKITVPAAWKGRRVFVVVGAADHNTTCTFDGERLGSHAGGYTPFEFELTELVRWGEPQELAFRVWDPPSGEAMGKHYLYGKQGYGNIRGIWQTVYLEARGDEFVESLQFVSDVTKGTVSALARLGAPAKRAIALKLEIDGRTEEIAFAAGAAVGFKEIRLAHPRLWTLEDPHLYDVTATLGDDRVKTYFGFREIGTAHNAGVGGAPYVTLNGKPVYLQLTLDQSWNPDGWFTYPSDAAMRREIEIAKELALNGNRIHIKVEQPRKLYWADRLGLLIQADVPCAWGEPCEAMFEEHWKCFEGMVRRDFNHPSIYQWTLFNETWGLYSNRSLKKGLSSGEGGRKRVYRAWTQRAVADCYLKAKVLDPTRLVEDMSPCSRDHVVTDVNSWHAYLPGWRWEKSLDDICRQTTGTGTDNYIGGHRQNPDVPMMNSECGNVWGYAGSTGDCDFTWDYHWMINAFRRHPKCAGWLYTEHHDVINEWNGYVRADRTWKETGLGELFPGFALRDFHAEAFLPIEGELCRVGRPGETCVVPVDLSLVTDRFAGKTCELGYALRYFAADGTRKEAGPFPVALADASLAAWRHGRLADVAVKLPAESAAGTVNFTLTADGKAIARNFCCFHVRAEGVADARPAKSEWSRGTRAVREGRKQNGFGSGFFEYVFPAPAGAAVFRAEVSTKRLNGKDAPKKSESGDLDWMLGGGDADRSRNPNSYPQTSSVKYPGRVKVFANGTLVKEVALPDDPADHRGILSWNAQVRNPPPARLDEAGSYGYLVEAEIPAETVRATADGRLVIRLEAEETGLAVYGPDFGRYPFGPHVTGK